MRTEERCPTIKDGRQCVLGQQHDASMNATPHEFHPPAETERIAQVVKLLRQLSVQQPYQWARQCMDEAADLLSSREREEATPPGERARLHRLLSDAFGCIEPDLYPETCDAILAEIGHCDGGCTAPAASPSVPGQALTFIRSEAERTKGQGPLGEMWAAVLVEAERLAVNRALDDSVQATRDLRERELEAERIPSGLMEMRLRAADSGQGALLALVEKWRAEVKERAGTGCGCYGRSTQLRLCADELERAVRPQEGA